MKLAKLRAGDAIKVVGIRKPLCVISKQVAYNHDLHAIEVVATARMRSGAIMRLILTQTEQRK
jgi:hypothetical protein